MKAKLGIVLIVLAASSHSGAGVAEQLHTIDANGDGRQIVYAYCADPDPWVECLSHELKCSSENLAVTLGTFAAIDAAKAARALLDMGPAEASVRFLLANGKISVDLPISSLELHPNDMDGVWNLEINLYEEVLLWSALNEEVARGAKFAVGDQTVDLSPDYSAEVLLMKMKKACEKPAQ